MNNKQIALELTKLYFEQQDSIPTENAIIEVYFNYLYSLESKGK